MSTDPADHRIFATPAARRLAQERSLRLEDLRGSGPNGRIVAADVPAAASASSGRVVMFDRMRLAIAQRLTRSVQTIPQFNLSLEVDLSRAQAWRREAQARAQRITINDLIAWAVSRALAGFPALNSHVHSDRLQLKDDVDLGLAVSSERGLVVPVLSQAQRLDLIELAKQSRRLIDAARQGRLSAMPAASFTISNLGQQGITRFEALINPPECAILAVGSLADRPTVIDGQLAIRPLLTLTLGCDHRAVDGAYAAGFLAELRRLLEAAAF